ncbi:MAG: hypothetical protein Q9218_007356 [Villophora microphyllina]
MEHLFAWKYDETHTVRERGLPPVLATRLFAALDRMILPRPQPPSSVASTLILAGGVLAQYGSGSGYGSDSSYGSGSSGSGSIGSGSGSSSMMMPSTSVAAGTAPMSTGTSSGQVQVHVVKVSNKKGDLTFEPNNLQAAPGSMVQFHFYPKVSIRDNTNALARHVKADKFVTQNHSVVQSTFDQPCQPINNNNASVDGFFSGFMPVKANDSMMPSFTIMVNDTKPIWYYCSQGKHCQAGMVGVINPPAANKSRTIESFTSLAKQATENLSPGQQSTSSASSSTGSGSSMSGSYGSSGSSGSASSSASVPDASGSSSSSTVTMPLSGTNSTSGTAGAASPSGSAGGQNPQAFVPGSGASVLASSLGIYSSLALAGLVGFVGAGFL